MKKYWYHTIIYSCVLCGRERKYKERRYDAKPEYPGDRMEWHDEACPEHFI
jgi:hypothetical protein